MHLSTTLEAYSRRKKSSSVFEQDFNFSVRLPNPEPNLR